MTINAGQDRAVRLNSLFRGVISGKRQLKSSQDSALFLEAALSLAKSSTASSMVETFTSSSQGIDSLHAALRKSFKIDFLTSSTLPFLGILSEPEVRFLGDGVFLNKILTAVLHPRSLWDELLALHRDCKLQGQHLSTFAWLCFEVVSSDDLALQAHQDDVRNIMLGRSLLDALPHETHVFAYRIQKILDTRSAPTATPHVGHGPGGRHDNDFADFREINIFPTNDELLSKERPFLQRLDDVFEPALTPKEDRTPAYLGWMFRLLREDMLHELREDLQVAMGKIKGRRRPTSFGFLQIMDSLDSGPRCKPRTIALKCDRGLEYLATMTPKNRLQFLDSPNAVFKHGSLGALCLGTSIIAFGSMQKDNEALKHGEGKFALQMADSNSLSKALTALCGPRREELVIYVVSTPTFAYEPILKRLKDMKELPMDDHLLEKIVQKDLEISEEMEKILKGLMEAHAANTTAKFSQLTSKPLTISGAQLESLINGLKSPLAQIQGPPGTGKSFIGALIVRLLTEQTSQRVLVLSYTNHALDQFLSELVDIGVGRSSIVRLGSKASAATESLKLETRLKEAKFRSSQAAFSEIYSLKSRAMKIKRELVDLLKELARPSVSAKDILDLLEFSEDESSFWSAFQFPDQEDGFKLVLTDNKEASAPDLYNHWKQGQKSDQILTMLDAAHQHVWRMPIENRKDLDAKWSQQVKQEQISRYVLLSEEAGTVQKTIDSLYDEGRRNLVREMRVISCTTTGAAMYQSIITAAAPDVVVVEEAGEILEAHIVTALSPSVKQLILIGDHKQLRPKVNNYSLTVEKGDGYNLNVSMFERLILQGHHYTVLQEQHRSHPDISHYARLLAYPHLKDAPTTLSRESLKGLNNRVMFINHEHPEEEMEGLTERRDPSMARSKKNKHEAKMVLKTVKYLGQQGYNTENMVVLTPYLGQLSLLRDELSEQNDPVLNDLDSHELLRAGLVSNASTQIRKRRLRLSTIDNYQGEESDVVIVSLARSNGRGDIGFLYARERLVVLMSRAKNGIILFGNMQTFLKSKKGKELWTQYFDAMRERGCLFDGLPTRCEQHPERTSLLSKPEDFDQHCPDGGCAEACGAKLSCGKHTCQRRCHRLLDHSKTPCSQKVEKSCDRGHKNKVMCGRVHSGCKSCARDDEEKRQRIALEAEENRQRIAQEAEENRRRHEENRRRIAHEAEENRRRHEENRRRITRDLQLERERHERQSKYAQSLQELDDEIDHQRRLMKYSTEEQDEAQTIKQKREQLQNLKRTSARLAEVKKREMQNKATSPTLKKPKPNKKESGLSLSGLSGAKAEWESAKASGATNAALDKLMDLIGLESVKDEFLSIQASIDTKIRQDVSLSQERFSCSLLGNPGTGKTTVARLWGAFLTSTGAIPGDVFKETTGSKLASQGVPGCEKMIEDIKDDGGGVLFIDEAYQLSSGNSPGGKAVLDYLLAEVENLRGQVVFVLAGYDKEMESFFSHNPGLPSRFPITLKFGDYTDDELLRIFQLQIHKKFKGRMQLEDGDDGLYARIVARRIGRGRGRAGFGNARAVENAIDRILKSQAKHIREAKRAGTEIDELSLTKLDLIGPEPTKALDNCPAWKQLNQMIGLVKVKEELKAFRDTVITNYHRELEEEPSIDFSLNRVFMGPPGTGKTTVAKLYGQILAHLGLLSNGEVVIKNPSDFVGAALGQSEAQTKGILASTVGKVLVIDEAYGLCGGDGVADPYKTAVIDTIVAEVQSVPGDDRCVLLLGYDDQMQEMFQKVNPGLSRRFPMSSGFQFEDFDDDALSQIFDLKLKQSAFKVSSEAKGAALEVLRRARNRPNFGNAGEIDILLDRAKANQQKRSSLGQAKRGVLDAVDFDSDFDRATRDTDVRALFKGDVGREKVITLLEGFQQRVRELKSLDMDPKEEIPFSFLFCGPPGTGKTTTAKKMGKVYYDMGFLSTAEVIECSASEMIGQYVGQTGPKVQQLMEKALGKVLFIDEAYRLADGGFAKEAVDELVDCVTKPKYQGRLIIILAGYVNDMNRLLSINPGMSSRFPETIDFEALSSEDCFQLLRNELQRKKKEMRNKGRTLDISSLEAPSERFKQSALRLFRQLRDIEGWASGRDVKQIAKNVFKSVKLTAEMPTVSEESVEGELCKFLAERSERAAAQHGLAPPLQEMSQIPPTLKGPSMTTETLTTTTEAALDEKEVLEEESAGNGPDDHSSESRRVVFRDASVSDEVWEQLEKDKAAEAQREANYQKLKEAAKKAKDDARAALVKQLLEEEDRRKEEEAKKKKLAMLGMCPVGYEWIKQDGGYRCAGGSHWMSDGDIEKAG